MDTITLVENQIHDGKKLIDELPRHGFDVTTAFWLHASDEDRWRFNILSPPVDSEGLSQAYRRLHPLVRAMPQPFYIDPLAIKLIEPDHPIAKDILDIHRRSSGSQMCAIRWGGTRLGSVSIEGAYLYPLPVTAPT
jgi:hypothetical protein